MIMTESIGGYRHHISPEAIEYTKNPELRGERLPLQSAGEVFLQLVAEKTNQIESKLRGERVIFSSREDLLVDRIFRSPSTGSGELAGIASGMHYDRNAVLAAYGTVLRNREKFRSMSMQEVRAHVGLPARPEKSVKK